MDIIDKARDDKISTTIKAKNTKLIISSEETKYVKNYRQINEIDNML